jgi:hypothetical protein
MSCSSARMLEPVKPIVILDKAYVYQTKTYQYTFVDAANRKFISYERSGEFNKGDSIK